MITQDQFQKIIRLSFTILIHARQTYVPLNTFLERIKIESKRSIESGFIQFLLTTNYFVTRSSHKNENDILLEFR